MRRILIVLCTLLLAACQGIGLPNATPTVAPTRTFTPTPETTSVALEPSRTPVPTSTSTNAPTITALPSETLLPTLTFTATDTNEPTATLTFTPSDTNAPTATSTSTATATLTPRQTFTFTPTTTATFTSTPLPTLTPLPAIQPSDTPTPSPTATFTSTPSETLIPTDTPIPPSATPQPTRTTVPSNTPDLTLTAVAGFSNTPLPQPSFTPFPTGSPTNTLPPPTLDVTPTFITAVAETPLPDDLALTLTPFQSTDTIESFITPTETPAPTVANVNPPPTVALSSIPTLPPFTFSSSAFVIDPNGAIQGFNFGGNGVSNPTLLVQNPVRPDSFLLTDNLGQLFDIAGGQTRRASGKMFDAPPPGEPYENNGFVTSAAWSPDGNRAAFIVDSWTVKGREATSDDGVWFYTPGQGVTDANQMLIHCPENNAPQCTPVTRGDPPYNYRTTSVVWSPTGQYVLAEATTIDENNNWRGGLFVLSPGQDRSIRSRMLFYDYGDWSGDGQRLVVSGRRPDGRVILGSINLDGSGEVVALDGSAIGLWLQNGVQRPSGTLVALGRFGDPNGAMRIFDQNGTALTGDIGFAAPQMVRWNPGRDSVFVQTVDGRKYIASINGNVQDVTDQITGAVSWVSGRLPPDSGTGVGGIPADYVPAGVIEGSRFQPGQQLRVLSSTGILNLRDTPSLSGGSFGTVPNGSFVAILAGPVNADDVEWWQVQTSTGQQGWMAGSIDGFDVLVP